MRKKEERSKEGQTNNKAKQHSTPKAVTFPKEKRAASGGTRTHNMYTIYISYMLYMYRIVHRHVVDIVVGDGGLLSDGCHSTHTAVLTMDTLRVMGPHALTFTAVCCTDTQHTCTCCVLTRYTTYMYMLCVAQIHNIHVHAVC